MGGLLVRHCSKMSFPHWSIGSQCFTELPLKDKKYGSSAGSNAQWAKIAILVSLVKIFLVNHKNILIHLLYIFSKIFGYNQISSFLQNLKCQYLLNEKS